MSGEGDSRGASPAPPRPASRPSAAASASSPPVPPRAEPQRSSRPDDIVENLRLCVLQATTAAVGPAAAAVAGPPAGAAAAAASPPVVSSSSAAPAGAGADGPNDPGPKFIPDSDDDERAQQHREEEDDPEGAMLIRMRKSAVATHQHGRPSHDLATGNAAAYPAYIYENVGRLFEENASPPIHGYPYQRENLEVLPIAGSVIR